jgi:hypothetical protein
MLAFPAALTSPRSHSPFRASWRATQQILRFELEALEATDVVLELAAPAAHLRRDGGGLLAGRLPAHPGVVLSFGSVHGPLKYFTDVFEKRPYLDEEGWQCNVRAIALALTDLRRIDRYGVTRRGEQYSGWGALPPATPMGAGMSPYDAAAFLVEHGEWGGVPADPADLVDGEPEVITAYFRSAAKRLHPDAGGDPALFVRLEAARAVLENK